MALEVHDLLKINHKDVIAHSPIPAWAYQSLEKAPFVVVRRSSAPEGQVAIGIRGKARNERFAAFLSKQCVIEQVKPENLAERTKWKHKQSQVYSSLKMAAEVLNVYRLIWGPGGSVGFELASGVETVTAESDLDLIIRAPKPFPVTLAPQVIDELKGCPTRVDVQVETPTGAFSLMEYAKGEGPVLLKTKYGPKLTSSPWAQCCLNKS